MTGASAQDQVPMRLSRPLRRRLLKAPLRPEARPGSPNEAKAVGGFFLHLLKNRCYFLLLAFNWNSSLLDIFFDLFFWGLNQMEVLVSFSWRFPANRPVPGRFRFGVQRGWKTFRGLRTFPVKPVSSRV